MLQWFLLPTGAFHQFGSTQSRLLSHSTFLQCLCVQGFCPKSCLLIKPALTKYPESDQHWLLLHFFPCGFYLTSLGLTLFPAIQQKDSSPVNAVSAFQFLLSWSCWVRLLYLAFPHEDPSTSHILRGPTVSSWPFLWCCQVQLLEYLLLIPSPDHQLHPSLSMGSPLPPAAASSIPAFAAVAVSPCHCICLTICWIMCNINNS